MGKVSILFAFGLLIASYSGFCIASKALTVFPLRLRWINMSVRTPSRCNRNENKLNLAGTSDPGSDSLLLF